MTLKTDGREKSTEMDNDESSRNKKSYLSFIIKRFVFIFTELIEEYIYKISNLLNASWLSCSLRTSN